MITPPCIIKVDGTIVPVTPKNGKDFKLEELKEMIGGGYIQWVPIHKHGTELICDEEGMMKYMPVNQVATEYLEGSVIMPPQGQLGDVVIIKPGQMK